MRFFNFFEFQICISSNPVAQNDVHQKLVDLQHQVGSLIQKIQQIEQRVDGVIQPESSPTPKSHSNKFIASRIVVIESQLKQILQILTKNE